MSGQPSKSLSYRIEKLDNQTRTVIHGGISRGMLYLLLDKYVAQFPDSIIQYAVEVQS